MQLTLHADFDLTGLVSNGYIQAQAQTRSCGPVLSLVRVLPRLGGDCSGQSLVGRPRGFRLHSSSEFPLQFVERVERTNTLDHGSWRRANLLINLHSTELLYSFWPPIHSNYTSTAPTGSTHFTPSYRTSSQLVDAIVYHTCLITLPHPT